MNGPFKPPLRAQTSPSSATGSSPINGYDNPPRSASPYSPTLPFNRGNFVTPPTSMSMNGNATNSREGYFPARPPRPFGSSISRFPWEIPSTVPSPPASDSRQSDGTLSDKQSKKWREMEETLAHHHMVLRRYLNGGGQPQTPRPNKARDKLLRLSPVQFHELSTDVFDELQRRQAAAPPVGPPGRPPPRNQNVPPHLLPRNDFHEKRNHARQKLSSLQSQRFHDLATDVFCELERRFPQFQGHDLSRRPSSSSGTRSGPPSRGPTPIGFPPAGPLQNGHQPRSQSRGPPSGGPLNNRRPIPGPSYPTLPKDRGYPPRKESMGLPSPIDLRASPDYNAPAGPLESDFGRPTPKHFQSNTITPNKSAMVEDNDEEFGFDGQDGRRSEAFGLESQAQSLQSTRDTSTISNGDTSTSMTSKSASSNGRDVKLLEEAQAQITELHERIGDLEITLRSKDEEISALQDKAEQSRLSLESDWVDVKQDLEKKIEDVETLNHSMRDQLERLHTEQANVERDLRSQLEVAKKNQQGDRSWKTKHQKLERDYQDLQQKLVQQRQVTEDVRMQASGFLNEMRTMAERSGSNDEKEERLQGEVQRLEAEVNQWKTRYTKTKTQLRNMRASSSGLTISQTTNAGRYVKEDAFTRQDGLVKDVHVTKFQISIDELLGAARSGEPLNVLDYVKDVVIAVRSITQDIDAAPGNTIKDDEFSRRRSKLKSKVSATANNVITASKNFASSNGLSPVSLLDAAASHLTAAVVELLRTAKIRPTPAGEIDDDDDGTMEPFYSPSRFNVTQNLPRASSRNSVYGAASPPSSETASRNGSALHHRQIASRSNGPSPEVVGLVNGVKPGFGMREQDSELQELKDYLDDQTDSLVHSIQSLVGSIRSEDQLFIMRGHITAIASIVGNVVSATESNIREANTGRASTVLRSSAAAIVRTLADYKVKLLTASAESEELVQGGPGVRDWTQTLPPLAFRIAKETKDLVQRVDDAEGADFT